MARVTRLKTRVTRLKQTYDIAQRAFDAATGIINESAPDLGIAIAAASILGDWLKSESNAQLIVTNKTLQDYAPEVEA